ncbi:MAG TPA: hypothetical protein VJ865_01075 [Gemmatimonadaceae bacterium]|nr:hypothetical protein [Gemmatimonadaceae bacterium]
MTTMQTKAHASAQAKPSVRVFVDDGKSAVLQIPQSHDDMMALLSQRRVISEQLDQATERRNDLLEQMNEAPAAAKAGFQAQLNVVSDRIVQLESSMNVIAQEIAGSSPALAAMAEQPSEPPSEDEPGNFQEGIFLGAAGMFIGLTTLLLLGRWIWKRFIREDLPQSRKLPSADSERLQRVEQGIEAMAIEVERISEGQRFVTKLISESRGLESTPR